MNVWLEDFCDVMKCFFTKFIAVRLEVKNFLSQILFQSDLSEAIVNFFLHLEFHFKLQILHIACSTLFLGGNFLKIGKSSTGKNSCEWLNFLRLISSFKSLPVFILLHLHYTIIVFFSLPLMNEHIKEIKEHNLLGLKLFFMVILNLSCVNHHAEEKDDLAKKDCDHDDLDCVELSAENFGHSVTVQDIVGCAMCWSYSMTTCCC